jgi:hypothetical protein
VNGEENGDFSCLRQDDPGQGEELPGKINTMDESAVSIHMPAIKMQSKQWLKKGTPGPKKAKVAVSRMKQMVHAFFDNKGVIYTYHVPQGGGATVTGDYLIKALKNFLKLSA